jgi:hypothetical protein
VQESTSHSKLHQGNRFCLVSFREHNIGQSSPCQSSFTASPASVNQQVERVILPPYHSQPCIFCTVIHFHPSIHLSSLLMQFPNAQAHTIAFHSSWSLNPNTFTPRPQKASITLLISSSRSKAQANPRRPRPPLEQ